MIRAKPFVRPVLAAGLALSLAGCISLLPKSNPAQLYRFGPKPAASAEAAPTAQSAPVSVLLANGAFDREAAGDRILTLTGDRAAYIADSRWVSPAEVLFDQAVMASFDASGGHVRLSSRGAARAADHVLRLDVRNFETRYEAGAGAPPTVLIRVRGSLSHGSDVVDQIFEARAPAGSNRVNAIVAAYDRALTDVMGQIVGWTNQQAR